MPEVKLPISVEALIDDAEYPEIGEVLQRTLGMSAIAAGATGVSSPRLAMLAKQFSQIVVPNGLTRRLLSTGVEHQLIHGISDGVVDHDCEIMGAVQRYPGHGFEPPETVIIVRREGRNGVMLDIIDLPTHQMTNTQFGVKNSPTNALRSLHTGKALRSGTVLTAAPNRLPSGEVGIGVEANIALLSRVSVKEDGFAVSESFANRVTIPKYTCVNVVLGKNDIPLNLHGGENDYKIVPEIGELVGIEGLLLAMRSNDRMSVLNAMSSKSLRTPDYIFDTFRYVPVNAEVVDIKVVRSGGRKSKYLTPAITKQLDYWHNQRVLFLNRLRSTYLSAIEDTKRMYGSDCIVHESPALIAKMSGVYRELEGGSNTSYVYRGEKIASYWLEVTTRVDLPLQKGFKMADLYGAKGVICEIYPDSHMPVDSRGVRADVIADGRASTFARMNPGRLHEQYIGAALRDLRLRLLDEYCPNGIRRKLSDADYAAIQNTVVGLLSIINPKYGEALALLTGGDLHKWIDEIFNEAIYAFYDHRNMKPLLKIVEEIESMEQYRPHYGKVSYVAEDGENVEISLPTMIGSTTIIFIDKVADSASGAAVNTPYMNGLGMPVKPNGMAKPIPVRATKVTGEAETRAMIAVTDPSIAPLISDIDLNPNTIRDRLAAIVESPNPWQVTQADHDGIVPYVSAEQGTPPLMIIHHLFAASGVELVKGDEHDPNQR